MLSPSGILSSAISASRPQAPPSSRSARPASGASGRLVVVSSSRARPKPDESAAGGPQPKRFLAFARGGAGAAIWRGRTPASQADRRRTRTAACHALAHNVVASRRLPAARARQERASAGPLELFATTITHRTRTQTLASSTRPHSPRSTFHLFSPRHKVERRKGPAVSVSELASECVCVRRVGVCLLPSSPPPPPPRLLRLFAVT